MGSIIVISDASEKLAVRHSQLVVTGIDGNERLAPIEDLDSVIIDTCGGEIRVIQLIDNQFKRMQVFRNFAVSAPEKAPDQLEFW